jgi:hypothetical protein
LQNTIKPSALFLLLIGKLRRWTATAPPGTDHLEMKHRENQHLESCSSGAAALLPSRPARRRHAATKSRRREALESPAAAGSQAQLAEPPPWSQEQVGGRTPHDMNHTDFRTKNKCHRGISLRPLASTTGREKGHTTLTAATPTSPATTTDREERGDFSHLSRGRLLGALSRGLTTRFL